MFKSDWLSFSPIIKADVDSCTSSEPEKSELAVSGDDLKAHPAFLEPSGKLSKCEVRPLAVQDVFDVLPWQDQKTLSPEEFQAAVEFFSMLMKSRDDRQKKTI